MVEIAAAPNPIVAPGQPRPVDLAACSPRQLLAALERARTPEALWPVIHALRWRAAETRPLLVDLVHRIVAQLHDDAEGDQHDDALLVALALLAEQEAAEMLPLLADLLGNTAALVRLAPADDKRRAVLPAVLARCGDFEPSFTKLLRELPCDTVDWTPFLEAATRLARELPDELPPDPAHGALSAALLGALHGSLQRALLFRFPSEGEEIALELERVYEHELPVTALRAAQRLGREVMAPALAGLLRRRTAVLRDYLQQPHEKPPTRSELYDLAPASGVIFALHLLAEFRAGEAWPAVRDAVTLPGEGPFGLCGDLVTEGLDCLVALIAGERLEELLEVAEDRANCCYVRTSVAGALHYLVRDGRQTRDAAAARLIALFEREMPPQKSAPDYQTITLLTSELLDLATPACLDAVERAFDADLVETFFVDRNSLEKSRAAADEQFRDKQARLKPSDFDTVAELSTWDAFQPERPKPEQRVAPSLLLPPLQETAAPVSWSPNFGKTDTIRRAGPQVGRNDPCPCGSGKKYKKCCLRDH